MAEHVIELLREFNFDNHGEIISGRLVTCRCGRKILVDAASVRVRGLALGTLPLLGANCLECVDLSDDFRRDFPAVAEAIDRWIAESPEEEDR